MTHYHNRQQHDMIKLNASSSLSGTFSQINTNLYNLLRYNLCVLVHSIQSNRRKILTLDLKKNDFQNLSFLAGFKYRVYRSDQVMFLPYNLRSQSSKAINNQYKYFHEMLKSPSRHVLVVIKSVCHRLWITFKNLSAL